MIPEEERVERLTQYIKRKLAKESGESWPESGGKFKKGDLAVVVSPDNSLKDRLRSWDGLVVSIEGGKRKYNQSYYRVDDGEGRSRWIWSDALEPYRPLPNEDLED